MPKVKTNSSAKKRFKVTGTGKITHQKAFKRHILTKKSTKRKRNMRIDGTVAKANLDFVKRLLRLNNLSPRACRRVLLYTSTYYLSIS